MKEDSLFPHEYEKYSWQEIENVLKKIPYVRIISQTETPHRKKFNSQIYSIQTNFGEVGPERNLPIFLYQDNQDNPFYIFHEVKIKIFKILETHGHASFNDQLERAGIGRRLNS